jgi:hypothetical protein
MPDNDFDLPLDDCRGITMGTIPREKPYVNRPGEDNSPILNTIISIVAIIFFFMLLIG